MTEQTQEVLDTITGNRMADMQNQINQLQLSQAMCGVVRYPNTPDVIPVAWSNFTRQAVESETKSKAVETGMREWCKWEHETKELYAKSAKDLYDAGEVAAAHVICELVRDVDDECEYADRLALKLSAVDYDMQVIVPMRHELHETYRKKLHDVGKKLS